MTSIHYIITGGRVLDGTSRFVQVSVGQSRQADRDYLFLTAWAVSHGFFFAVRSRESADFFSRCLASVGLDAYAVEKFSARQCVRSIKAIGALPPRQAVTEAQRFQHAMCSDNYRIISNLRRVDATR